MKPLTRPRFTMPSHGLSWPVVMVMLALIASAAAFWWHLQERAHEAQVVARVGPTATSREITRRQIAEALRSQLWSRSEAWEALAPVLQQQRRVEALDRLIASHALQQWALAQQAPEHPTAAEDALQTFIKQFEIPDSWRQRSALQQMNEVQLHIWMEDETRQRLAFDAEVNRRITTVTPQEIKAWIQDHATQVRLPERISASHVFLSGHDKDKPDRTAEINDLHRRLLAGEVKLSALAGEVSEDGRSNKLGGSLGWFSRDRVPADFAEKVFSQKTGELGIPFRTGLGWHIVQVQARRPARAATFEEAQAEVAAHLTSTRRSAESTRLMEEILKLTTVEKHLDRLSGVVPES
ncbi:peptidylprolyl isomerase [Verrucomicrobium sp. BvORR106]|uniref:peptidylprolyl isomerase n=1 Tax=Verrucomicrobium sp. BvORR106 TaxID=1403819 RepID=UPI00056F3EDA|nr:peptidylprolyl isomerase [Verrucomicrobium sp. BvORR106]